MATTLVVSFTFGRYHATPWGRHVNEGAVELPPSPWRLLRALYAVWQTRAPELHTATVEGLLKRLAEPPVYYVPPFRLAHTRHYYPDSKHRSGATPSVDRTLDAFAIFPPNAELAVHWPFDLDPEQHKALDRLVSSLPYLGRADSVCSARLADDWQPPAGWPPCAPVDVGESIDSSIDVVRLLCLTLPLDLEALTARPVDVRAGKLLFPSSTKFVGYLKPQPLPTAPRRGRKPTSPPINAIRFSVLSRVAPSLTDAVTLTDRLRRAAIAKLDEHPDCSAFAGKTPSGEPLRGHRHPHYLALPDEEHGEKHRIAELAIWIPAGCADDVLLRLSMIRSLHGPKDLQPGPVSVRMSGYGSTSDILPEYTTVSRHWESATPFVATGFRKKNLDWQGFVRKRVIDELRYRKMLVDVRVEPMRSPPQVRVAPRRPFRSGLSEHTPMWLRLEFDQPIRGPIALGHLVHFGLGLFRAK